MLSYAMKTILTTFSYGQLERPCLRILSCSSCWSLWYWRCLFWTSTMIWPSQDGMEADNDSGGIWDVRNQNVDVGTLGTISKMVKIFWEQWYPKNISIYITTHRMRAAIMWLNTLVWCPEPHRLGDVATLIPSHTNVNSPRWSDRRTHQTSKKLLTVSHDPPSCRRP